MNLFDSKPLNGFKERLFLNERLRNHKNYTGCLGFMGAYVVFLGVVKKKIYLLGMGNLRFPTLMDGIAKTDERVRHSNK